jgi:WD40 repeat protein
MTYSPYNPLAATGCMSKDSCMQLLLVADTLLEAPASALLGSPIQPGCFVACFPDTISLFISETLSGKVRLLERIISLPPSSSHPTAVAYHPQGLYIGTSTGIVLNCTFQGALADTSERCAAIDGGGAITLLSANRDVFAAVATGSNVVHIWPHASHSTVADTISVHAATSFSALAFGGPTHRDIAAMSDDGLLLTISFSPNISSSTQMPPPDIRVLSDTHCGRPTSATATGRRGEVATVGADGSLRLWDAASATVATKRTFSAPLTAVAASSDTGLVAVGASSGLIRIVALGGTSSSSIDVVSRVRVSRGPVDVLVFAPPPPHTGGALLAALSCDIVYLVSIARTGGVRSVRKLSLTGQPIAVAFARGLGSGSTAELVVSFSSSELQCVVLTADGEATGDAERRMKLPAPLVSFGCLQGPLDTIGMATGVCADRVVRSYELSAAVTGWGGSKGRTSRAVDTVATSGSPIGALSTVAPGTVALAAHVFTSGAVQLAGTPGALQLGEGGGGGGLVAAAFDATAQRLLLAAADGSIFSCEVVGAPGVPATTHPVPAVPCELDMDTLEDEADAVFGEARPEAAISTTGFGPSTPPLKALSLPQQELLGQFKLLRQRLQRVIEANAAEEPRARLPRAVLAADEHLITELQAERAQRVARVRAASTLKIDAMATATARIRAECWESLAAPPRAICGARNATCIVQSFPLLPNGRLEATERQLAFLRRVEQAEERASGVSHSVAASRCVELDAEGRPAGDPGVAVVSGLPAGDILYSDWDLSTAFRRVANARFLAVEARRVRSSFNAEFDRAAAAKAVVVEKVKELNRRLAEVGSELEGMGYPAREEDLECLQVRVTGSRFAVVNLPVAL